MKTNDSSTLVESGGTLQCTPASSVGAGCGVHSRRIFDLTSSSITIQVVQPSAIDWEGVTFEFGAPGGRVMFRQGVGSLWMGYSGSPGSPDTQVLNAGFDPTKDVWWRLSEKGGVINWWTSPDGVNFTQRAQVNSPFAVDSGTIDLESGLGSTVPPSPMTIEWDNCNLTP